MTDLDVRDALHDLRDHVDGLEGDVDAVALLRARRRLLARALGPELVTRRSRRHPRRLVVAAVATVLLAAGPGVVQVTGVLRGGASPAAAAALERAADITLTIPDPVVGPDQYLKITETRRDLTVWYAVPNQVTARYFTTLTTTRWIPGDRTRTWVIETGCPSTPGPGDFLDAQSEAAVAAETAAHGPRQCESLIRRGVGPSYGDHMVTSPWMAPDGAFLAGLPRDPHALLARVRDGASGGDSTTVEDQMMGRISDVLRTGTVPADLRAALFRTAALIPGVDVVTDAATLDGHTGVAVARTVDEARTRVELVLDPESGLVIGQRTVQLRTDDTATAGLVTDSSWQRQEIVDTAP